MPTRIRKFLLAIATCTILLPAPAIFLACNAPRTYQFSEVFWASVVVAVLFIPAFYLETRAYFVHAPDRIEWGSLLRDWDDSFRSDYLPLLVGDVVILLSLAAFGHRAAPFMGGCYTVAALAVWKTLLEVRVILKAEIEIRRPTEAPSI